MGASLISTRSYFQAFGRNIFAMVLPFLVVTISAMAHAQDSGDIDVLMELAEPTAMNASAPLRFRCGSEWSDCKLASKAIASTVLIQKEYCEPDDFGACEDLDWKAPRRHIGHGVFISPTEIYTAAHVAFPAKGIF